MSLFWILRLTVFQASMFAVKSGVMIHRLVSSGVSSYSLNEYQQQLAAAGAQGLFSKQDVFSPAFMKAIHAVASGNHAECPGDFPSAKEAYARLHTVPDDTAGFFRTGTGDTRLVCAWPYYQGD